MRDLVPVGKTRYVPLLGLPGDKVQEYWQVLAMHDTLKYRLCDTPDPTWKDVLEMILYSGQKIYHIVDEEDTILAEFSLCNRSGNVAQGHYSCHPRLQTRYMSELQASSMARVMEDQGLRMIYGILPVENRAAIIMALKAGFKKFTVIPEGISYLGRVIDATVIVKER